MDNGDFGCICAISGGEYVWKSNYQTFWCSLIAVCFVPPCAKHLKVATLTFSASKKTSSVCDRENHEVGTGCARRRWPAPHISPRAVWLARRVHGKLPRSHRTCCPTGCSHGNLYVHCLGSKWFEVLLELAEAKAQNGHKSHILNYLYYFDLFCLYTSHSFRNVLLTSRLISCFPFERSLNWAAPGLFTNPIQDNSSISTPTLKDLISHLFQWPRSTP